MTYVSLVMSRTCTLFVMSLTPSPVACSADTSQHDPAVLLPHTLGLRVVWRIFVALCAMCAMLRVVGFNRGMFHRRDEFQMVGIDTIASRAQMMALVAGRNRPNEIGIKQSVRLPQLPFMADNAIAFFVCVREPNSTGVKFGCFDGVQMVKIPWAHRLYSTIILGPVLT